MGDYGGPSDEIDCEDEGYYHDLKKTKNRYTTPRQSKISNSDYEPEYRGVSEKNTSVQTRIPKEFTNSPAQHGQPERTEDVGDLNEGDYPNVKWDTHTFSVYGTQSLNKLSESPTWKIDLSQFKNHPEFKKLVKSEGSIGGIRIKNVNNGFPVSLGVRGSLKNMATNEERLKGTHHVPASDVPVHFSVPKKSSLFTKQPYVMRERPADSDMEPSIISQYNSRGDGTQNWTVHNLMSEPQIDPKDNTRYMIYPDHMLADQYYLYAKTEPPNHDALDFFPRSDIDDMYKAVKANYYAKPLLSDLANLSFDVARTHAGSKVSIHELGSNFTDHVELSDGIPVNDNGAKTLDALKGIPHTLSFDVEVDTTDVV